jgi:hypothetical protein
VNGHAALVMTFCHQVPSAAVVMRHLGIFYYWHIWQPIPLARVVCR